MAWLAVDKNGDESVFNGKPYRVEDGEYWDFDNHRYNYVHLPNGTIKKIIGRELTWKDEPVELK